MSNPWTIKQREILKEMREAGHDWDQISEATNHPADSCRTRAATDNVRKFGDKPLQHHKGIVGGPEMFHMKSCRPLAKPMVIRPCISCKRMFKSWDRTKNQRCDRCNRLSDANTVYM